MFMVKGVVGYEKHDEYIVNGTFEIKAPFSFNEWDKAAEFATEHARARVEHEWSGWWRINSIERMAE